jgi:antirestriction protein ArdC
MHAGAHSTLHSKRLDRKETRQKWGDEAYAIDELRAVICSKILAAQTGVPTIQVHIVNHRAYSRNWIKAMVSDPMAIFSAGHGRLHARLGKAADGLGRTQGID